MKDEILEIWYEYGDKLVQPDPNTNVVIAAFTTAYARLQLYDELDMLQERVMYYDTDSVIYLSQPGQPEPWLSNYIGDFTDEIERRTPHRICFWGTEELLLQNQCWKVKVRRITLDCTARQKVNFEVICALVYLWRECGVRPRSE